MTAYHLVLLRRGNCHRTWRKLATKDGQALVTDQFRFVHVWEKRGDRWLLTADQVTVIKLPPAQQITKQPTSPARKHRNQNLPKARKLSF